MATSCNSGACNELITIGDRFQYSVQIIGENGRPKTIHENKWVVMEDVECYTILPSSSEMFRQEHYVGLCSMRERDDRRSTTRIVRLSCGVP